ncbi:MAG TPA: Uma2 family endonuclease [Gemmatimonadaceae bacterium]
MPAHQAEWTAEMARALPEDGKRYEVLDGELFVTPAPGWKHQIVLVRLLRLIDRYVEEHRLGWTLLSPADIEFSARRLLQPDLFVVPARGEGEPRSWRDVTTLLLTVEALSPSTARADRLKKRPIYQEHGVPEYWIVDTDTRIVERWRPGDDRPEVIADVLEWQPKAGVAALRIDLAEVFGPID